MSSRQPGILAPVPPFSRYLEFRIAPDADLGAALSALKDWDVDEASVVGLGASVPAKLGKSVAPLRPFPVMSGPGVCVPSTQADLWCWLRGDDRGHLLHKGRDFESLLGSAFLRARRVDGFKYDRGLDLSGYEDGTENPKDEAALAAAILAGAGAGLDGSSFVAVQQWVHDLDRLGVMAQSERDNIVGRRQSDNEELDDAPPSAHVKRTAQESFSPEAFVLRRSMPWADGTGEGLMFVAFGKSFDAYEAQLTRMTGGEDGITDGLFRFTRPVSGSYFWCPPVADGALDLSAIGA